jgi:NAD(P)-dependent dehydrogenase (short-subunit alcohol dehydrogenase family)
MYQHGRMGRPQRLTVLITGAGSGIGQALTQHFTGRHCRVVAAEFPPQQWQKLIDILLTGSAMLTRAVPGKCIAIAMGAGPRNDDAVQGILFCMMNARHFWEFDYGNECR